MARMARVVCPGFPYHVTQRGNRRGQVFFNDEQRQAFLDDLGHYSARHALEILAYCLMDNHVHLVAVPGTADSLHHALKPVHLLHAQRINKFRQWTGHLWQDRFHSTALDERHFWTAIRYVARNPVEAGIVRRPERYRWSSVAAHCGRRVDPLLTTSSRWLRVLSEMSDWSNWLDTANDPASVDELRNNTRKGLPTGSQEFVRQLEQSTGLALVRRPRGRPPRATEMRPVKG